MHGNIPSSKISGWPRGACSWMIVKNHQIQKLRTIDVWRVFKTTINTIHYLFHHHPSDSNDSNIEFRVVSVCFCPIITLHHCTTCTKRAPFPSWVHQREWEPRWISGPPPMSSLFRQGGTGTVWNGRCFPRVWCRLEDRSSMNHDYSTNHPRNATYPPPQK